MKLSLIRERLVHRLLNGRIHLLPGLHIMVRRLISTNRSINRRHRQK